MGNIWNFYCVAIKDINGNKNYFNHLAMNEGMSKTSYGTKNHK